MGMNVQSDEVAMEGVTEAGFGDDDLGRLQGILFGDHAKKTNDRIATLEEALLGALGDLRASVDAQFAAMERRIDAEADTRSQAISNVSDQVKEETRVREREQKALRKEHDKSYEQTTSAIDDLEERAARGLDETKQQVLAEIESGLQNLGDR